MSLSIQEQLAERIKALFPDAQVKKINKDNFLDIHIPSINSQRSTHLFFNTAKNLVKTGFYCRDEDFTKEVLDKSTTLEAYSQGIRPAGNPEFVSIEDAIACASSMLNNIAKKEDSSNAKEKPKKAVPRKEKKETKDSKKVDKVDSKERKTTTNYCFEDPQPFLTAIQCLRNYYLALSSASPRVRSEYEKLLKEFTISSVVPKVSDDIIRITHEEGFGIEALLLKPMFDAEEIYDKEFETHKEYVSSLEELVNNVLSFANESLVLETIGFLIKLGNLLEDEESPLGFLTLQDRYFPIFLILRSSPKLNLEALKGTLEAIDYEGADKLLLKASGNFNQLSADEKLALMLYDFILVEEKSGFDVEDRYDIKLHDIDAAKRIFTLATKNSAVDTLLGGFDDNDSFEIFQFFNIYFHRDRFHDFCLDRWKELSAEWNELKLQLLIEGVKRDFHPNTYINNPVLDSYLEVFGGVKSGNLDGNKAKSNDLGTKKQKDLASPKKSKADNENIIHISEQVTISDSADGLTIDCSMFHKIIVVIIKSAAFNKKSKGKYSEDDKEIYKYTDEAVEDIMQSAVAIMGWFNYDEDETATVVEEAYEMVGVFDKMDAELCLDIVAEFCYEIHETTNEMAKNDIIRFMTDHSQAGINPDIEWDEEIMGPIRDVKLELNTLNITVGRINI